MSYKIGLTGGVGSGKSTVARAFSNLGGTAFSADEISHELTEKGKIAYLKIVKQFGTEILLADGKLDRARLGDIIFNDDRHRARLEGVLHPLIMQTMHQRADITDTPYVVLDIPLLVGTEEQYRVDRILVVDCDRTTRMSRIKKRNSWSEKKINAVMLAQASDQALLDAADDVIDNNTDFNAVEAQVAKLHLKYRELAVKKRNVM